MKPSPSTKRSVPLDFLRGLAIALVLGFHFNVPAPNFAPLKALTRFFGVYGSGGVDLFFVLSGFLVGGLLMNEHIKRGRIGTARFLWRRGFKIWPQYYVFILLSMGLSLLHRDWNRLGTEVPNLLHLQNYLRTPHFHTWSLAVEEHFYLVLALVLGWLSAREALSLRTVVAVFGVALVIATGSRFYYVDVAHVMQGTADEYTNSRIDTLALGVLLAAVFHFRRDLFDRIVAQRLALVAGLALALAGCWAVAPVDTARLTYGFTLRAVAAACLLLLVYGSAEGVGFLGKAQRFGFYRGLAWVGQSSYGIYLWHIAVARPPAQKVYDLLARRSPDLAWVVAFVVWAVGAALVGYFFTKAIEVPFLHLRDRRLASTVPPPDLAGAERNAPETFGPLQDVSPATESPGPVISESHEAP